MLHQEGQSGRERDEHERQAVLGDQGKRRRRIRSRIADAGRGKRIFFEGVRHRLLLADAPCALIFSDEANCFHLMILPSFQKIREQAARS
jgi:hypothetical protein